MTPAFAAAEPKLRSLPPTLRRLRIGTLAPQQPWRPAPASVSAVLRCSAVPQPDSAGSAGLRDCSTVSRPPDRSFPLLRCFPLRRPAPGRSNVPFPRWAQMRLRSIPLRSGKERLPQMRFCASRSFCSASVRETACRQIHSHALRFSCGTRIPILFTAFTTRRVENPANRRGLLLFCRFVSLRYGLSASQSCGILL